MLSVRVLSTKHSDISGEYTFQEKKQKAVYIHMWKQNIMDEEIGTSLDQIIISLF